MKLWQKLMLIGSAIVLLAVGILSSFRVVHFSRSLEDTVADTTDSVVYVGNVTCGWSGSGVAITSNVVLTARHVAENGVSFTIKLNDGREFSATEAITSKKYDLGFIRLDDPVLSPAVLGSIDECRPGRLVYTTGSPFGLLNFNSITLGVVSKLGVDCDAIGADYGWSATFVTDAASHPGNSGCPVFTYDGVVRGIVVGGYVPALIYCVPVDPILEDVLGGTIELMFLQGKYQVEKAGPNYPEYWPRYFPEHYAIPK